MEKITKCIKCGNPKIRKLGCYIDGDTVVQVLPGCEKCEERKIEKEINEKYCLD